MFVEEMFNIPANIKDDCIDQKMSLNSPVKNCDDIQYRINNWWNYELNTSLIGSDMTLTLCERSIDSVPVCALSREHAKVLADSLTLNDRHRTQVNVLPSYSLLFPDSSAASRRSRRTYQSCYPNISVGVGGSGGWGEECLERTVNRSTLKYGKNNIKLWPLSF